MRAHLISLLTLLTTSVMSLSCSADFNRPVTCDLLAAKIEIPTTVAPNSITLAQLTFDTPMGTRYRVDWLASRGAIQPEETGAAGSAGAAGNAGTASTTEIPAGVYKADFTAPDTEGGVILTSSLTRIEGEDKEGPASCQVRQEIQVQIAGAAGAAGTAGTAGAAGTAGTAGAGGT